MDARAVVTFHVPTDLIGSLKSLETSGATSQSPRLFAVPDIAWFVCGNANFE
jgi:hypothetical protein